MISMMSCCAAAGSSPTIHHLLLSTSMAESIFFAVRFVHHPRPLLLFWNYRPLEALVDSVSNTVFSSDHCDSLVPAIEKEDTKTSKEGRNDFHWSFVLGHYVIT